MKRIITILSGIYIVILLIVYFGISMPLKTQEGKVLGIKSVIPASERKSYTKNNWKIVDFRSPAMRFRVAMREGDEEDARKLEDYYIIKRMKYEKVKFSGEEWSYGYEILSEGWWEKYKLLFIFPADKKVYWIELNANSNYRKYADLFNEFLVNMEIDGKKQDDEFAKSIKGIKLPGSIFMKPYQILGTMLALFILSILMVLVIFQIGWRRPRDIPHGIIKMEKTFMSIRKKGKITNLPGLIILGEGMLYIYSFGKKILERNISQDLYIEKNYLVIEMKDGKIYASLSRPEEWRMWFPVRSV